MTSIQDIIENIHLYSKEQIKVATQKPSFDEEKLKNYLDNDEFNQIMFGHLHLDHILSQMLEEQFTRKKKIDLNRMAFSQKLSLADALGLISEDIISPIKKLNAKRNDLVHNLNNTFNIEDLDQIKVRMPQSIKDAIDSNKYENISILKQIIIHLIFILDADRQRNLYNLMTRKKWEYDVSKFLEKIDKNTSE